MIATEIAGPAIGHFERNGRKKFGEPRKIGLLQNGPGHWRPKPWGQHLGTRAQPGGMSSRPRGPLPSNAQGEKSALFFRAFFRVSAKQFRSVADRWRFSAIGHAGPASCMGTAGAYLILCSHTALCSEWSRGEEHLTVCPASAKNGPRDLGSNQRWICFFRSTGPAAGCCAVGCSELAVSDRHAPDALPLLQKASQGMAKWSRWP